MKIVETKIVTETVTGIEFDLNELATIKVMLTTKVAPGSLLADAKNRLLDKINSINPEYRGAIKAFTD